MAVEEVLDNEKLLIDAFDKLKMDKNLDNVRLEIEKDILTFIKELKKELSSEQRIFETIESRTKSIESFMEKIKRKDYIHKWEVKEKIDENQSLICKSLPDLIGYRINCFFLKDEKIIYDKLKEYYELKKFMNEIVLSFDENTTQENGHEIYKLTGIYKDSHCFEIQIKSIMHNVWGEVEHKTIYKNKQYDANIQPKKIITEEIFNILKASDRQLLSVFSDNISEDQLIQALFFEKTKEEIANSLETDILAKHYNSFFNIFNEDHECILVKQFVAKSLLNIAFEKEKIVSLIGELEKISILKEKIQIEFSEYKLKCLYIITSAIYEFENYEFFITYLADYLITKYSIVINKSFDDDLDGDDINEDDVFGDDEYSKENIDDDLYEKIIIFLKKYIG